MRIYPKTTRKMEIMKNSEILKGGDKFGKLTFTGEYVKLGGRQVCRYTCDCGNSNYLCRHYFVSKRMNPTCGCESTSKGWVEKMKNHGIMYPFFIILNRCKKSAKPRKLEVSINEYDIKETWEKQNGECFYTGIQLELSSGYRQFDDNELSPSIDRIDSNLSYTKDNIKIVHREINRMKLCLSHDKFIEYCKIISERFKNERKH